MISINDLGTLKGLLNRMGPLKGSHYKKRICVLLHAIYPKGAHVKEDRRSDACHRRVHMLQRTVGPMHATEGVHVSAPKGASVERTVGPIRKNNLTHSPRRGACLQFETLKGLPNCLK